MSARGKAKSGRSSQTVRRGKAAMPKSAQRRAPREAAMLQRLLAAQPLSPQTVRRVVVAIILSIVLIVGYAAAVVTGVADQARQEAVAAIGRAGFAVKRIEVVGANRLDRMRVYDIALKQRDRSMAAFNLEEVRTDLRRYGWVADARVSRRLPDTLVIDLVEREPVAVWQNHGRYVLIAANGKPLPGVDPGTMQDLPVLAGEGANERIGDLNVLLDSSPALRPRIAGASWVGNRRWDLLFHSGETLMLPEGSAQATAAFAEFARLDGVNRLLGRGIRRFDMRIPDRFTFRPGRDGDLSDLDVSGRDSPAPQPRPAETQPVKLANGG